MIILPKTIFKFEQFKKGLAPKPRYRIHILPNGIMLCFAVVNGKDHGEEVYRYEYEWLSELDYETSEE